MRNVLISGLLVITGCTASTETVSRCDGTACPAEAKAGPGNSDSPASLPPSSRSALTSPILGSGADPDVNRLPYDANGWTIFPHDYEVSLYVDSASNPDAWNFSVSHPSGNTPDTAIHTIATLQKVMGLKEYVGKSMRVLLKRGSQWPNDILQPPRGGTADHPLLISGSTWYDSAQDPRPQVGQSIVIGFNSPNLDLKNHIAIEGVEVGPGGDTGSSVGIKFNNLNGGTDYLVEDCVVSKFYHNIDIYGDEGKPVTNLRFHRNQILDAVSANWAGVGLGGETIRGLALDENIFDLNGVPNRAMVATENSYAHEQQVGSSADYSNMFAHDIYFVILDEQHSVDDVRIRGNLFSRTLQSVKGPASGIMSGNLFYNFSSGGYVGMHGTDVINNAMINGGGPLTIGDDNAHYPNTDPNVVDHFIGNLFQHVGRGGAAAGAEQDSLHHLGSHFDFEQNVIDDSTYGLDVIDPTCFGVDIKNNKIDADKRIVSFKTFAKCPIHLEGNSYSGGSTSGGTPFNHEDHYVSFEDFESNFPGSGDTFSSQPFTYSNPDRDIASYMREKVSQVGSTPLTLLGFLNLQFQQSKLSWNSNLSIPRVTQYFLDGHDVPNFR